MEFIREKIKEKPISKRRLFIRIGIAALYGLVFSAVVCVVLMLFIPILKEELVAETGQTETAETEMVATENTQIEGPTFVLPPDMSLSISDYQSLQDELYNIGSQVNNSIVTVTSAENETDWMNNAYEAEGQSSGVIVLEDDNYLYVLTEKKALSNGPLIRVSFIDGTGANATLLKYDGNTGIAVITVEKRLLDSSTKNEVQVATFGDSDAVPNGSVVIALGSPLGTNYSILTGNITSIENKISTQDKNYSVFTTDIVASEKGSGVLVNTNGEVVGMVIQSFSGSQDVNTLTAVAINEIELIIDTLANGKDVPYIGLYISTVTDDISEEYDIPKGVYIKDVATDSPAMYAGLQSGDVIIEVNKEEVSTDEEYSDKIGPLIPGTTCEITAKRQNGDEYYEVTCMVEIGVLE